MISQDVISQNLVALWLSDLEEEVKKIEREAFGKNKKEKNLQPTRKPLMRSWYPFSCFLKEVKSKEEIYSLTYLFCKRENE